MMRNRLLFYVAALVIMGCFGSFWE